MTKRRKRVLKTVFDKGGSIWGTRPPLTHKEVCRRCEKIFEVSRNFSESICPECKNTNKEI